MPARWTRPTAVTLPGGATKAFTYDPLMRVTAITSRDQGANVLLSYAKTTSPQFYQILTILL